MIMLAETVYKDLHEAYNSHMNAESINAVLVLTLTYYTSITKFNINFAAMI